MRILAIDLGKSKSAYCLFDTRLGQRDFGSTASSSVALRKLMQRTQPTRVVVEICPLAARVHEVGTQLGVRVDVADTTQAAWQWKHVKRKSDRDDAAKLAELSALGGLNLVHIPDRRMRQWRKLVETLDALRGERTRCKNRIRALLLEYEHQLPAGKRGWTNEQIAYLREELSRPLESCGPDELWRGMLWVNLEHLERLEQLMDEVEHRLDELAACDGRVSLVESIPGFGPRTAEVVVTSLDDPQRFRTGRQVGSYAGLTPRRYQSGERDIQGRISKRGSSLLRWALNQAAWMAVRYNPHLRAFYHRVCRGRRNRRKVAIVAVMRKLLVLAWALLRDGSRYRPPERELAASG